MKKASLNTIRQFPDELTEIKIYLLCFNKNWNS